MKSFWHSTNVWHSVGSNQMVSSEGLAQVYVFVLPASQLTASNSSSSSRQRPNLDGKEHHGSREYSLQHILHYSSNLYTLSVPSVMSSPRSLNTSVSCLTSEATSVSSLPTETSKRFATSSSPTRSLLQLVPVLSLLLPSPSLLVLPVWNQERHLSSRLLVSQPRLPVVLSKSSRPLTFWSPVPESVLQRLLFSTC